MLRSEHIPFNFFSPFNHNKTYFRSVLNDVFQSTISSVDEIKIEYAPKPKEAYLNDATSFDVYIEYSHNDSSKGIIGIEVKYTEHEYGLKKGSTQEDKINDPNSRYYSITEKSGLYKVGKIKELKLDKYRQIWRNHLLGASILLKHPERFKHFSSVTIFPNGNTHFVQTSKDYIELLSDNNSSFIPLTYEDFFALCEKYCPDTEFDKWISYLRRRYLVPE